MKENRDFKGVWIPKEIWLNTDLSIRSLILFTIFIFTSYWFGALESSTAPMQSQRVVMTIISESIRACTWASSSLAFEFAKFPKFVPAPRESRLATPQEVTDVTAVGGVVCIVMLVFGGLVFTMLYSVTFVQQPLKSMAPIDMAYTKMLNDIVLLMTEARHQAVRF